MTTAPIAKRVIGVDGGGSKTIAWIADAIPKENACGIELHPLGRGQAGPSNVRSVGFDTAFSHLSLAISCAIQQASIDPASIDVACLSLAGAGRAEEQSRIQAWCEQKSFAKRCIVIDDIEPLRSAAMYEHTTMTPMEACSWDACVTLVVGTGSIARGVIAGVQKARSGGWGYLLGDEGSGFSIGLAGLRSICQACDRGGEWTDFHREMMGHLGLSDPTELVGLVYQPVLPRAKIAEVSELVIKYAEQDAEAASMIESAIHAMVQLVMSVTERLEIKHRSFALVLSGGILCNHPRIVSHLRSELQRRQMSPRSLHLVREPIYGPLLIASAS